MQPLACSCYGNEAQDCFLATAAEDLEQWLPLDRVMGDVQHCGDAWGGPLLHWPAKHFTLLLCVRRSDSLSSRPTPGAPPAKGAEHLGCGW